MFFVKRFAKSTFDMLCGSPQPIFSNPHNAKHLSPNKLNLSFVGNKTRVYGLFATTDVHDFILSIADLVNTFYTWCLFNLRRGEWSPVTKSHCFSPLQSCYNTIVTAGGLEPPRQLASGCQDRYVCQFHHAVVRKLVEGDSLEAQPSIKSPYCKDYHEPCLLSRCKTTQVVSILWDKLTSGVGRCRYARIALAEM